MQDWQMAERRERVYHPRFGFGTVTGVDDGNVTVEFDVPTGGYRVRSLQSRSLALADTVPVCQDCGQPITQCYCGDIAIERHYSATR